MKTTRPSSKLDFKDLERFRTTKKISSHAFKLELPTFMKIHPVFHVSLIKPYISTDIRETEQEKPGPVEIEGEEEYVRNA